MPVHVNQLTARGRFPSGASSAPYDCTVAAGVMALDDYTGGALRPTTTELRARQRDQSGGIGLDDIAVAWRSYGYTFRHGPSSWSTVMARLRAGRPLILQGNSGALGTWKIGRAVPHALYVTAAGPSGLTVHDPLASGPRTIPESAVRAFYVTGLALAGWGDDAGAVGAAAGATPAPGAILAVASTGGPLDGIGTAITDALGRAALLGGIVVLGVMGAWLLFREPSGVTVNLPRGLTRAG